MNRKTPGAMMRKSIKLGSIYDEKKQPLGNPFRSLTKSD